MLTYSVIIPVYKVEKYLSACVDSVLAQDTASAYEIILVDDGSPDNCGAICDDYAARHENVRVIHQHNKGLSGARNTGIDAARGDYLLFVDSDDLWAPETLSSLDPVLAQTPDVIAFGCQEFCELGDIRQHTMVRTRQGISGQDYLEEALSQGILPLWSAWSHAYRREFFISNHLRFNEAFFDVEDWELFWRMISLAQSVITVDRPLYRYRKMREGSITFAPDPRKILLRVKLYVDTFRWMPHPLFADTYCQHILNIIWLKDPKDRKEMTAILDENRDILQHVQGKKQRVFRLSYRLFGWYGGAAFIDWLLRIKHFVEKILGIHHL